MQRISPQIHCCKDIFQAVFELSSSDMEVYKTLRQQGTSRADVLAKRMEKERSTVYRSLQRLTSCGLCIKTTHSLETGGYFHTYACNDLTAVKQDLESCVDRWYTQVKEALRHLEEELADQVAVS